MGRELLSEKATVRLSPGELEKVELLASARGLTVSSFIREVLLERLGRGGLVK